VLKPEGWIKTILFIFISPLLGMALGVVITTKLKPVGGFAAETAGGLTLFLAVYGGIPVSTTHTTTGAIAGVGATKRLSAVRWGVARRVLWAWVLTIPMSALIAALSFFLVKAIYNL
jgi:PiT family inorganic phosphate transporter